MHPIRPHADAELITLIAHGDSAALGELYDRHASTLLPIAMRILRDRSEAEDVLHDVFVLMSDRAMQYDSARGPVIAWLIGLVRNLSIDRVRRRVRHRSVARRGVAHQPTSYDLDPERLTVTAIEYDQLHHAVAALPETLQRTVAIAFFEELTYARVAARENRPVGTIKSRISRALDMLREATAGLEPTPEPS